MRAVNENRFYSLITVKMYLKNMCFFDIKMYEVKIIKLF